MSTCPIFSLLKPLAGLPYRRKAPGPHGFHQKGVVFLSQPDHFFRLGGVIRHRLFTQHRNPGVQGRGHIIHMGVVRRGDIHHVRLGLPEHFFKIGIRRSKPVFFRIGSAVFLAAGNHCGSFGAGSLKHSLSKPPGDKSRADHGPFGCFHKLTLLLPYIF